MQCFEMRSELSRIALYLIQVYTSYSNNLKIGVVSRLSSDFRSVDFRILDIIKFNYIIV